VLPDLRINAPLLEPDRVLLEQLSQLSRASAPVGGPGRAARSMLSAGTVLVVAGLSWVTGTLPGVASPFDGPPAHQPSHQQAPLEPSDEQSLPTDVVPPGPAVVPPGLVKPHQDNGNHTGQTKPHQNSGNHTGQTKPHQDSGNHTGQTKPQPDTSLLDEQGSSQGGGQANGHGS
jgi:hypothetical protein